MSGYYGSWISQIVLLFDPLDLGSRVRAISLDPRDPGSCQVALSSDPVNIGSCFFWPRHMSGDE